MSTHAEERLEVNTKSLTFGYARQNALTKATRTLYISPLLWWQQWEALEKPERVAGHSWCPWMDSEQWEETKNKLLSLTKAEPLSTLECGFSNRGGLEICLFPWNVIWFDQSTRLLHHLQLRRPSFWRSKARKLFQFSLLRQNQEQFCWWMPMKGLRQLKMHIIDTKTDEVELQVILPQKALKYARDAHCNLLLGNEALKSIQMGFH